MVLSQLPERFFARPGVGNDIARRREGGLHHPANLRLVVYHQDAPIGHFSTAESARGGEKENSDPSPGRLFTQIRPPSASTISRAMASPMPDPGILPRTLCA